MPTCTNCNGPITASGHAGRAGSVYCCFGCLRLGERSCARGTCDTGSKPGGVGLRLGLGVLVVGQSMIFGLALNLHDDVPLPVRAFTQWGIFAGTVLVALSLGGPLVRTAARELCRGRLTIEALFLLTMTGALCASLQAHVTGRGKVYFEVVSVLLVVYTLGKVIGARSKAAALASSRAWGDRLCACRLVDGTGDTRPLPVSEVRPGDVVEVHPGELIAVDGIIREGVGFMSEAVVSGEPFAVVRRPGDRVLAGSASFDATFRITATASGTEREIDRLLATVEEVRDKPLSLQGRADRLGRWFLPLVVCVALGTFTYWTFLTSLGWEAGLFNAMSVLLVACPCVIGLATPVVIWSAINRLAERGVIVKSGDAIERLATVDRVMFDKTGTLTEDRFALVDIETTATGDERAKLLGWLSLVQAQSNHPIAKPFAELPRPFARGEEPRVGSLVAVPGSGVVAELVEVNGTRHEIKIGVGEWIGAPSGRTLNGGEGKVVCVARNGVLVAVASLVERLRDSTPQALAHFAQLGLSVEVLTGDATERAESLGLSHARGGMLPDDKRAAVEGGRVLFVGDGINDASALAVAHVGVALSSGTDLAVSAAPVTLYSADLRTLPWAVELSRDAVRAVRLNLARAVAYNLIGMALAASGVLHPVVAALLMVVSSLTLIFSSTRVGILAKPQAASNSPFPSVEGGIWRGVGLAFTHAAAFALQGVVFLLLLVSLREPLAATLTLIVFALTGIALACLWRRYAAPHGVDMCFGMLTLGNLGMLLGWWADNGFAALHDHGCCACVEAMRGGVMKPWMWVGMVVFANVAMRWFGKFPATTGCHSIAMLTGGNVGMVLGMLAGGCCAAQFPTAYMTAAVASNFAGMTVGMLAGMLAGTWLCERLYAYFLTK